MVENHLISEGGYGNCDATIGVEEAGFEDEIGFWIDLQEDD